MLQCFPSGHLVWVPRRCSMGMGSVTAVGHAVFSYLTVLHMAGASRAIQILDKWGITISVCKFKHQLHCVSSLVTWICPTLETSSDISSFFFLFQYPIQKFEGSIRKRSALVYASLLAISPHREICWQSAFVFLCLHHFWWLKSSPFIMDKT